MTETPVTEHLPPISEQRGGDFGTLAAELEYFIEDAITSHPRSAQKALGPSEVGCVCPRKLAYKILDVEPANEGLLPWKPTIGTAMHTWLEQAFRRANRKLDQTRFLLEHRVHVGTINDTPVVGSCDLYDRVTATSVDFKLVGAEQLHKYKANGPGQEYRAQAHLYGRGWTKRGHPVDTVAIMFLPRDREFREGFTWHEPYDAQVAIDALTRVEGIDRLTTALGTGAPALLPTADDWCHFCPFYLPASTELDQACPGHVEQKEKAA